MTEKRHKNTVPNRRPAARRSLANFAESSEDAIIGESLDSRITSWNKSAERLFGYSAGEVVGHPVTVLYPTESAHEERDLIARIKRGVRVENFETLRVRKDGSPVDVSLTVSPILDRNGKVVGAAQIARDISEQKRANALVGEAHRLQALGHLVGGICHDFNNILTVIMGSAEVIAERGQTDGNMVAAAQLIEDAAKRGRSLTQTLLAFARLQPLAPRAVDVNALVGETIKLLRPTLGEHIELRSVLANGLSHALVDPSELSSGLLNLALNSRDAMPEGGKLAFETRETTLDESYTAGVPDLKPGRYVMIAVSDTGHGIPKAIQQKIFEPFFTTKEYGRGTGLGLSRVYGFVKQSGGHIRVYSEEGHGTTLKIYLPRSSTAEEIVTATEEPLAGGGSEVVLIVEDDDIVRSHVQTQLSVLGYRTLTARDAGEAMELSDRHRIDLLFTDVVMPGKMKGRELATEMVRRYPHVGVLFTSGYTENAIIHHGRLDAGVLLLQKPYTRAELARMVRESLRRRSRGQHA